MELKKGVHQIRINCSKTYNSYIVTGDKTALIDTVPESAADEFIAGVEKTVPIGDIDYIICNHTEPDRAGCVGAILEKNPEIVVIGTIAALRNLKEITDIDFKSQPAKDGERLNLGEGKTLKFIITPNMHWPDTMVTYLEEDAVIFSCDIFSCGYFDAVSDEDIDKPDEYRRSFCGYYNKMMKPFGDFVRNGTEKIAAEKIELICTGNGPIIKKYVNEALTFYKQASSKSKRAAVIYTSEHGYTKMMACEIAKLIENAELFDAKNDFDSAVRAANECDILIFGSPTINRNASEEIWNVIAKMDAVSAAHKPCFVFGSYGWGGEALAMLQSRLKQMRLDVFEKPFGCILKPLDKDKKELTEYTKRFIEKELR